MKNWNSFLKNPVLWMGLFAGLLALGLCTSTLSVYGYGVVSLPTLLSMAGCCLTVLVCDLARRKRLVGAAAVGLLLAACFFGIRYLAQLGRQSASISFWQWVITQEGDDGLVMPYLLALILGACVFFGITVYYFSVILYRISFLTLISMVPLVLYIKVMDDVNNWYLVLIAGCNLLIHLAQQYMPAAQEKTTLTSWKKNKDTRLFGGGSALLSMACFCFLVLFLAAVLPKQTQAPFYQYFSDRFLTGDTTSALSGDYGISSDTSGNADNYRSISDRRLYTIYGSGYTYLKKQTFDAYDFDKDCWYSLTDDWSQGEEANEAIQKDHLRLYQLCLALKAASIFDPDFAQEYHTDHFMGDPIEDSLKQMYIQAENFQAEYCLSSARVESLNPPDAEEYQVSWADVYSRLQGAHREDAYYSLYFYDQWSTLPQWESMGGCDYTEEEAKEMLTQALTILQENQQDAYVTDPLEAFLAQQELAEDYQALTAENTREISPEIKELAEEITQDLTYDYQKAQALADYFTDAGFVYDLEYVAEDTSPEYFLFTSKTGTCSDFASAYTLMARSIGLNVRYVEGFAPEETTRRGYYYISEKNAHAYPEVFIQNVGWVVYEPTVGSGYSEEESGFSFLSFLQSLRMDYGLIFTLVIVGILFGFLIWMIRVLLPFIGERIFRLRLTGWSPERAAVEAYERLYRKKAKADPDVLVAASPGEFADYCKEKGWNIAPLVKAYEQVTYQEQEGNLPATRELYQVYKEALRKRKGKDE